MTTGAPDALPFPTAIRDLEARWAPTKQRLYREERENDLRTRVHRAASWLRRAETAQCEQDDDLALACRWFALNALYGRWDEERGETEGDQKSLNDFLDVIRALDDADGRFLPAAMEHRREEVLELFDSVHLSKNFWRDPGDDAARAARRRDRQPPRQWYDEQRHGRLVFESMRRIYFLRCQIVHGAATLGSRLNRGQVRAANRVLETLVPAMLAVVIDHGAGRDWGDLCYPPMNEEHRPPDRRPEGEEPPRRVTRPERAIAEVVALHDFFTRWFRGEPFPGEDDEAAFARCRTAFAPDFRFHPPGGGELDRDATLELVRAGRGRRMVAIEVADVEVLWSRDGFVALRYEERQRDDDGTAPTRRRSVAILRDDPGGPNGLRWTNVVETWNPGSP